MFAVPLNQTTETLFYNHRMIIDSPLYSDDGENRAWLISKVNRISPHGIVRITLAQDVYDQHHDYIERDEDGNVIGMWADYLSSEIEPADVEEDIFSPVTAKITCSGKPQIKVGGSAKTFTINYYDYNDELLQEYEPGLWRIYIGETLIPNILVDLTYSEDNRKVKVKFLGDDSYIGSILTVKNTSNNISASLDVEIVAL